MLRVSLWAGLSSAQRFRGMVSAGFDHLPALSHNAGETDKLIPEGAQLLWGDGASTPDGGPLLTITGRIRKENGFHHNILGALGFRWMAKLVCVMLIHFGPLSFYGWDGIGFHSCTL